MTLDWRTMSQTDSYLPGLATLTQCSPDTWSHSWLHLSHGSQSSERQIVRALAVSFSLVSNLLDDLGS